LSTYRVLITGEDIQKKVSEIAGKISTDYRDRHPILIGVLKGSFVFMADLVRKLSIPVEIDFVQLASYEAGRETSGCVRLVRKLETPVKGRHVLVIEDIVDSGLTLSFLLDYLGRQQPASLKVCAMFDKPSRRNIDVPVDYVGFTVPDEFFVGYGLDFNQQFRCLPDLCILEEQN